MKKLLGIVGTNSDNSTNRKLLQYMETHFSEKAEIELVEIKDLPMFVKDKSIELPESVKELSDKVEQADGVIISTPEYDHSVPAALMNALSWLSFKTHPFVDKPVMVVGASYGTLGSSRAQMHARQILDSPELKARIMPSSEYLLDHSLQAFDEQGQLISKEKIELLDGLFSDFLTFVEITGQLMEAHAVNVKEADNYTWED
ncbi:NADPH-dependent FMN reductase [Ruoffia tabacinasalis]|uniref:NAD(P)H-dependent oxidoreductase n=1 Tax=Ruoffia tabacinasalis TaxID=87458 RepID=A0A5R9EK43_9LACT|nr:NADPH-dependent FMN reductase [Ruoffia tabacinasalis]MBG9977393.1 NAD(P)H-dependent oxidoreductase [Ruoffia tabacinasalis]MBZ6526357.1 NAD(P)H-dependent oxidoreductase [Aerococcaceae bacterium DSM 111021]TLQ49433.1 NAD(P)H-dependent oxidoreductase [Ruoffia tabacinasalis]